MHSLEESPCTLRQYEVGGKLHPVVRPVNPFRQVGGTGNFSPRHLAYQAEAQQRRYEDLGYWV